MYEPATPLLLDRNGEPLADIRFEVEEAQIKGIRSPTATTSLAVAIILALGHRLEAAALKRQPSGRSKR